MSLIASFYLLPESAIPKLNEAARQPVWSETKRWLFFIVSNRQHNPYWEFVFMQGKALEEYHWSGRAFLALCEMLEERKGISVIGFDAEDISKPILEARRATDLFFRSADAQRLLLTLESVIIADDEI